MAAVLLLLGLLAWAHRGDWMPEAVRLRDAAFAFLREVHPVLFFTIFAIAPLAPVPISPFYLVASVYPLYVSIPGIIVALSFNMAVAYWLGMTLMRPFALRVVQRSRFKLPQASRDNERMVNALVRISGMPYTAQNYVCALAGVSFRSYMLIGVPIQVAMGIAATLLANSLLKGRIGPLIAGLGLFVVIVVLLRQARKHFNTRRKNRAADTATDEPGADSL